jgi:hypothetical protein
MTLGAPTLYLTAAQNGKHNHVLTDLGHFHVATQVAHTHGIDEHGGHTHGFVSQPVVVDTFNAVEPNPGHNHGYGASATTFYHAVPPGDTHTSQAWDGSNIQGTTDTAITIPVDIPPFTVSGTTDQVATGLSIIVADPAITVNPEETGITLADSGDGDAHENRPPFFASFYVMRVG